MATMDRSWYRYKEGKHQADRCPKAVSAWARMASSRYQAAIAEIRTWLAEGQLDSYADILLDQGYDDLPSIRRCNEGELLDLLALFRSGPDRQRARRHIDALCERLHPGPPSPSSIETMSTGYTTPLQSMSLSSPSTASIDTSAALRQECRVRIRCVYLYDEEWVDRYLALEGDTIWGYPDHVDQMPEFSVDVANPRTVMKPQNATVVSITDRGQHHLLVDFGRPEILSEWMDRVGAIRAAHLPPPSPPRPVVNPEPEPEPELDYERVVLAGQVFKKIKHTTASRRMLFCTSDLDKLVWSRPNVAHDVCGFLRVIGVQHIDIDTAQLRLQVVTATRTLVLQAADTILLQTWAAAIRWVHEKKRQRQIQREIRLQDPAERQKMRRRRERCEDLLTAGEVFHKLKPEGGGGVTRKLACTSDMVLLQWRDETRGHIKGQIAMADIAWVEPEADTRFRIVAKQRVIELNAVNVRTRDIWVEVLSFWIYLNSDRYESNADRHQIRQ